ncbi:MAG TPA: RHS repeat-associated core domain-containing protein [Terriglobales bacterium]|nr:RHS repeat-associated core domain-containing protein [Terriglobales bacterium]
MANVTQSGAISYYFTDHLGSTVLMTDGSGNVLAGNWPHAYTAFGADDPHYVAPTERRRYTGKERDPESGLDYFESRYYSSAAGRFLSPDEADSDSLSDPFTGQALFSDPGPLPYADITSPRSLNKYLYGEDEPLRFTDPDGHCAICVALLVGATVGATAGALSEGFAEELKREKLNWGKIGHAAEGGAVTGALTAVPGLGELGIAAKLGAVAASTVAGGVTERAANHDSASQIFSPKSVGTDAAAGVLSVGFERGAAVAVKDAPVLKKVFDDGVRQVLVPRSATEIANQAALRNGIRKTLEYFADLLQQFVERSWQSESTDGAASGSSTGGTAKVN